MLNKDEQKKLQEIINKPYMTPVINRMFTYELKHGLKHVLDYLHEIILASKDDVEVIIQRRVADGLIKDANQSRKSIVGSIFPFCVMYVFLNLKDQGLVDDNLYITSNKNIALLEKMVTVYIDGETQKPDMDLIIYSEKSDKTLHKCMIISLKTSLRERAGQTYRWKLLLEIATTDNAIKDKYNISYDSKEMPIVCFATINFYDEINSPQHRGMLKFFDNSFIGKPVDSEFISRLSALIDYAHEKLSP
jgi:type II restriction enzyme